MPRIPTSKPQNVAQSASTGGKIDTRSSSGFFKSIQNASEEVASIFAEAAAEKQKLQELNAANIQKIDQISESSKLTEALIQNPTFKHQGIIDDFVARNNTARQFDGVTKEYAQALRRNQDLFVQQEMSNAMVQSTRKLQSEAFANADAVSRRAIQNLDPEQAINAYGDLLTGHQRAIKEREIAQQIEQEAKKQKDIGEKAIIERVMVDADDALLRNDAESLETAYRQATSDDGPFAGLSDIRRLALKNGLFQKHQTVIARRSKAFGDMLNDSIENGVLNEEALNSALDNNLIMDEHVKQLKAIFATENRTKELAEEFREQKTNVSYKTIDAELDSKWMEKFATGKNTDIKESTIKEIVGKIDGDPSLGVIAKNKLKAKLALVASQAVLKDDGGFGVQLGDSWDKLDDSGRKFISKFAASAAKLMGDSANSKLILISRDQDNKLVGFEQSFSDVLLQDMNHLADEISNDADPQKFIDERLSLYRVGRQRLEVRSQLLTPQDN